MVAGQMLFKASAPRLAGDAPLAERLAGLATDGAFLAALTLYGVLAVAWVWILSFTPLSRAYPFVALAFVLTPVLGAAVFGEALTLRLVSGLGAILIGLWLVAG
jgi:drug/metabolite transporter (DMT)-like permease